MASSYTTSFGIEKIGSGEQSGAWGTTTNHNLDILDRVASYKAVGLSGTTHTLTVREASPDSGTENLQDGMYRVIKFTGALGANNTVTIAPNTTAAYFIFINATTDSGSSGPYSVILTQGSGANITIPNGFSMAVYCDGAGSGAAIVDALSSLNLSGKLTVGGTVDINGNELILDADADTSITADTDDQIDIRIAGADDFAFKANSFEVQTGSNIDMNGTELILDADGDTSLTADTDDQIDVRIAGADDFAFKANTFEVQTGSNIDMNGTELILDADGDTSITADTDDQIDIRIAGADDFQFTANTFTVPSGSTLEIASGGTIANSGTATGFGSGASAALDNLSSVAINTSLVSDTNNTDDLGTSSIAWKDLYIAGNIHIGGTGSANALDDYETGTFTPVLKFGTTNNTHASAPTSGFYTKVGPGINFSLIARMLDTISGTGSLTIEGLPFTANCPNVPMQAHATFNDYVNEDNVTTRVYDNTTVVVFYTVSNGSIGNVDSFNHGNFADGANKYTYVTGYYETD